MQKIGPNRTAPSSHALLAALATGSSSGASPLIEHVEHAPATIVGVLSVVAPVASGGVDVGPTAVGGCGPALACLVALPLVKGAARFPTDFAFVKASRFHEGRARERGAAGITARHGPNGAKDRATVSGTYVCSSARGGGPLALATRGEPHILNMSYAATLPNMLEDEGAPFLLIAPQSGGASYVSQG